MSCIEYKYKIAALDAGVSSEGIYCMKYCSSSGFRVPNNADLRAWDGQIFLEIILHGIGVGYSTSKGRNAEGLIPVNTDDEGKQTGRLARRDKSVRYKMMNEIAIDISVIGRPLVSRKKDSKKYQRRLMKQGI